MMALLNWLRDAKMVQSIAASNTAQGVLICAAMGLVIVVAFSWAAFFRKQRRHRSHHRHRRHHTPRSSPASPAPAALPSAAAVPAGPGSTAEPSKGSTAFLHWGPKRRRSRRSEPPRNPTLSETSGLPPIRDERNSTSNAQTPSPDSCKRAEP